MNFTLFISTWIVLLLAYVIVFIYRKQLSTQEDDSLHVTADSSTVTNQVAIGQKLENLERWSKILGLVVFLYGLVIGALYLYNVWQANTNVVPQ